MVAGVSKTKICNTSLIKVDRETVTNVDTDLGIEATTCKHMYDVARLQLLRIHSSNRFRISLLISALFGPIIIPSNSSTIVRQK